MTRHNDDAHTPSTAHGAQTRHNGAHQPRFRWSDEAHHEAHTRHTPTRHNGCTPLGVRRAVCRRVGAGFDRGGRSDSSPPLPKSATPRGPHAAAFPAALHQILIGGGS